MARGTGETTRQMQAAPRNAVFIWCAGHTGYPQMLARKIGREDLKIVTPDWLTSDKWRGLELTGLIVDHAANIRGELYPAYLEAKTRVRPRLTESA